MNVSPPSSSALDAPSPPLHHQDRRPRRSLRWRLSLFTALLTLAVLAVFCGITSVMLYYEQIDVLEDVMVNASEDEIEDEAWDVLEDLFAAFGWALPIGMALIGAGSWWMLRRELRPLQDIVEAAGNIDARTLGARLPLPGHASIEIAGLTTVLNGMLARLDQAFQQTIRFTADASHELRTPLTIIRGELEAALQKNNAAAPTPDTLAGLLEQVQRLSDITEQLLILTRADAGRLHIDKKPLNISQLLSEVVEDAAILADPRAIQIETRITPGISLCADASALRRVLLNLLENAVKYNHPGGQITCALRATAPARTDAAPDILIEIANTGPGIPAGMEEKIFRRFVRVDDSRSRETGGGGLGLSICHELITAHHGHIQCRAPHPGWTLMTVALPGDTALPPPAEQGDPEFLKIHPK